MPTSPPRTRPSARGAAWWHLPSAAIVTVVAGLVASIPGARLFVTLVLDGYDQPWRTVALALAYGAATLVPILGAMWVWQKLCPRGWPLGVFLLLLTGTGFFTPTWLF